MVLPLFTRRHDEYTAELRRFDIPANYMIECGRSMLKNMFDVELQKPERTLSAGMLFKIYAIEPAKKLKALEEARRIDWR